MALQTLLGDFVKNKVPKIKKGIDELVRTHHITKIHAPFLLLDVFLLYVDEHIEFYQDLQPSRDKEIDEEWQLVKYQIAKNRHSLWNSNSLQHTLFFKRLEGKLLKADILPVDFSKTISLWLQVLAIANATDVILTALYMNPPHFKNALDSCVKLPRADIEQCFYLVLQQLSKNLSWVGNKITSLLLPYIQENEVIKLFSYLTEKDVNIVNDTLTFSKMQTAFQEVLRYGSSCNLSNKGAIASLYEQIGNIVELCDHFTNIVGFVKYIEDREKQGKTLEAISTKQGDTVYLSPALQKPFVDFVKNFYDCHLLVDAYITPYVVIIHYLLLSLGKSNEAFESYKNTGILPHLAVQCTPFLPDFPQYNEEVVKELELESSSFTPRNKKKTPKNPKPERQTFPPAKINPKQQKQRQKTKKDSFQKAVTPKASHIKDKTMTMAPLISDTDPFAPLMGKLFKLCLTSSNPNLRNTLWHLDALACVQRSFKNYSLKDGLALLDVVGNAAQKSLEQAYSFHLKYQNSDWKEHSLKVCHHAFDPLSSCPEIMIQLDAFNQWARYFYIKHANWNSSTQKRTVPPLLKDLVDMAEGVERSKNLLQTEIDNIANKTRSHLEDLFKKIDVQSPETEISKQEPLLVHEAPIHLDVLIDVKTFDKTEKQLALLLSQSALHSQHPSYLYMKQALASLKMLKTSLQMVNTAQHTRQLSTWVSWSVQQLQEVIEDAFHAIEFLQNHEISIIHELKTLSSKVGLEMGTLGEDFHQLSYKSRYPADNLGEGMGSWLVDNAAAARFCPDLINKYTISKSQKAILWKAPSEEISPDKIVINLDRFAKRSEEFLRIDVLPVLAKLL